MSKNQTNELKTIIGSMLVALFANIANITQVLNAILINEESSIMTLLYIWTAVLLVVVGLGCQHNFMLFKNKKVITIVFLLLCYYIITLSLIGKPHTDFTFFATFTLFSLMIASIVKMDTLLFLRTTMLLSAPSAIYADKIFVLSYSGNISMGLSYAFLLPSVVTIVYVLHYLKHDSKWLKVCFLIVALFNLKTLLTMLQFGSRGPVLCILCTVLFFLIYKPKKQFVEYKKGKGRFLVLFLLFLVVTFKQIMIFISHFFSALNIRVVFVDKILSLSDSGDISNGRSDLVDLSISGIMDNPIFGHGIDLFDYYHPTTSYPHNFILQMAYDLGVPITLFVLFYIIRKLKRTFSCYHKDKFILIWTLFFASVPSALFSNDLWANSTLWLFFGYLLYYNYITRYDRF